MTLAKTTLYAPAEPFAEAIREWVEQEARRRRCAFRAQRDRGFASAGPRYPFEVSALRALSDRTNINRDLIADLAASRREWIDLERADRLALAMDTPLCLLAEEFKTLKQWAKAAKAVAA